MKMSEQGRKALVEASEGCMLKAYRDCVGVWSVGFGHTSACGAPIVSPGLRITAADADNTLAHDLERFEHGVEALLKREPLQCEFDALVDLAFNIGLGNFRSSSLLRFYNAGKRLAAADAFLDWNRAGGRVISGLTHRRALERSWFLGAKGAPAGAVGFADVSLDMAHGDHDHPDWWPVRLYNDWTA